MQTVIEDLRRAIDEAAAQFAQLNDAETSAPLAADKWSRKQLLGHLIDSAANNHQRPLICCKRPTSLVIGCASSMSVETE